MLWRRSSVICDTALLIEAGPSAARGSIWRRLRPKLSSVLGLAAAVAGVGDPTAAVPGAEGPGAAAPGAAGPTAEADATLGAEGLWNPSYGTRGGSPYGGACLPKDTLGFLGMAEDLGFAAVWISDHLITPLDIKSRYPHNESGHPGYIADTEEGVPGA